MDYYTTFIPKNDPFLLNIGQILKDVAAATSVLGVASPALFTGSKINLKIICQKKDARPN